MSGTLRKWSPIVLCLALGQNLLFACRSGHSSRTDAATTDAALSANLKGPRIAFDATSFDFGNVIAGKTATHLFALKNTGDRTLVIDSATTSCDCTAAVLKSRQISPGDSGQIEVRFTGNAAGPFHKRITVSSNDPRQPATTLNISATVTPDIDYEPHYIKLVTDDPKYRTQRVRFTGSATEQLQPTVKEVTGDAAEVKHVNVRIIQEPKDGKLRPVLELSLKDSKPGSGSAAAIVNTGLPDPALLGVPFSWGESVKLSGAGKK